PPLPFPVVSPGNLDTVMLLHDELRRKAGPDREQIEKLLGAYDQVCGWGNYWRLGVDRQGYREDWALVKLVVTVDTTALWDIEELQDELAKHCIELPETFVGDIQEVVEVDAGLEDAK